MNAQCPGMDPQHWKPQDISEQPCRQCHKPIEFWKDDVKRICPGCGCININERIGGSCVAWCDSAAECTGNDDITRWKSGDLTDESEKT